MIEIKKLLFVLVSLILLAALATFGGSLHFGGDTAPAVTPAPAPVPDVTTPVPAETAAATSQPTPAPTPEPTPQTFTLSFVGDITPDTVAAYRGTAIAYQSVVTEDNLGYVFEKTVQYFEDDDFTLANFECVLTDSNLMSAAKNFTFKAPASYAGILTAGSVEFVTLGNNHVLDYGTEGYSDTKDALDEAGVGYAGRDEYNVYVTDSGLVIGIYAVSFGTEEQIKAGVAALMDRGADIIIAALHYGDEGSYEINDDQTAAAHAAIDAGADVVYGSHPHTLQPIEQYKGCYIFHSMGNWSFGGNTDPRDKDTFIAQLTVTKDAKGDCSITDLAIIPCASSGVVSGNNYQPVPYEEGSEEYQRTLTKLDGSFTGANLTIGYTYGFGEFASGG